MNIPDSDGKGKTVEEQLSELKTEVKRLEAENRILRTRLIDKAWGMWDERG